MEQEAFVYLWYDASNKKYYLGKRKGTPDDAYTHSSKSSDEFCSIVPHSTRPISERREFFENMPKGVSRRILAYGTDGEMCALENELLINRKKRCWDRYYNESLGDPSYIDQYGKNNPNFEHGIYALDSETIAEYESMKRAIKSLGTEIEVYMDILKDIRDDIKKRNYEEYSKEEIVKWRDFYKDKVNQLKRQKTIAASELYYWKEGWTQHAA